MTLQAFHNDEHDADETAPRIPISLAYLSDRLQERMPKAAAKAWPDRFLSAIPVGADLSDVTDRLMHWLMDYVSQFADEATLPHIRTVQSLYQRKIDGEAVARDEWRNAAKAAVEAAKAAADAAAKAAANAAVYAAYAAVYAADAAVYAADAAAYAAVYAADAAASLIGEKLLELLAEPRIPCP